MTKCSHAFLGPESPNFPVQSQPLGGQKAQKEEDFHGHFPQTLGLNAV